MLKWILLVICVINASNGLRNSSINFNNNQNVTIDSASLRNPQLPWFLNLAPFFDLTKIPNVSPKCRRDFQLFLDALVRLDLWALKSSYSILISFLFLWVCLTYMMYTKKEKQKKIFSLICIFLLIAWKKVIVYD